MEYHSLARNAIRNRSHDFRAPADLFCDAMVIQKLLIEMEPRLADQGQKIKNNILTRIQVVENFGWTAVWGYEQCVSVLLSH